MILGKIEFDNDIAPELISRMIAEHKRQQMNMERVIDKSAQTHTHTKHHHWAKQQSEGGQIRIISPGKGQTHYHIIFFSSSVYPPMKGLRRCRRRW